MEFCTLSSRFRKKSRRNADEFETQPHISRVRFRELNLNPWPCDMIAGRTSVPTRFITRGSLLSLCLLAFLACDARPAWATCGDYLHGHSPAVANRSDSQMGLPMADQDHRPTPRPKCTGPQCQQNRHTPGAPTKSIPVPVPSDAILMVVAALTSVDDFFCHRIATADRPVAGFLGGIFRPPQAA